MKKSESEELERRNSTENGEEIFSQRKKYNRGNKTVKGEQISDGF
jgi:hypothetical protein